MDLYIGESRQVTFDVGIAPTNVVVTLKGVQRIIDDPNHPAPYWSDYTMSNVTVNDTQISFELPYKFAREDKSITVVCEYDYIDDGTPEHFSMSTVVNVVTPIVALDKIRSILGDEATTDETYSVERAVRTVIRANTGQSFGHYKGVHKVFGSGNTILELPDRAISIYTINGVAVPPASLHNHRLLVMNYPSYSMEDSDIYYTNGVIWAPTMPRSAVFNANVEFDIDGEWGWTEVPQDVREAATLLVNDYACQEIAYRDRYLKSINSADWSFAFDNRAWESTGNVRADQLLKQYKVYGGMAVL